jgi:hypothetical protein
VSLLVHVTVVSAAPAGVAVAVNEVLLPTARVTVVGDTDTFVTAIGVDDIVASLPPPPQPARSARNAIPKTWR